MVRCVHRDLVERPRSTSALSGKARDTTIRSSRLVRKNLPIVYSRLADKTLPESVERSLTTLIDGGAEKNGSASAARREKKSICARAKAPGKDGEAAVCHKKSTLTKAPGLPVTRTGAGVVPCGTQEDVVISTAPDAKREKRKIWSEPMMTD